MATATAVRATEVPDGLATAAEAPENRAEIARIAKPYILSTGIIETKWKCYWNNSKVEVEVVERE